MDLTQGGDRGQTGSSWICAARRAKRSRNDENMKFRYLRELRRLLGQKGWTDRDCRDLLLFIEWIINLKDPELREDDTSLSFWPFSSCWPRRAGPCWAVGAGGQTAEFTRRDSVAAFSRSGCLCSLMALFYTKREPGKRATGRAS